MDTVKLPTFSAGGAVIWGGLLAGALDLAAAFAITAAKGGAPVTMLQYIASARMGAGAFEGGLPAALMGVFIHFGASLTFAAAYVVAATKAPLLRTAPLLWGAAYGLIVYAVMTFLVTPLSRAEAGAWPPPLPDLAVSLGAHLFLFGLPIALAASRMAPTPPVWKGPSRGLVFGALGAVLWGGLAAGILDLAAVVGYWAAHGVAPVTILQSIATSLLGDDAFAAGARAALLGLGLHFAVSFVFAGGYVAFSAQAPAMRAHPVVFGFVYGLVVNWIMAYAVVPLTRATFGDAPPSLFALSVNIFIHTILFGLPIALAASRIRK